MKKIISLIVFLAISKLCYAIHSCESYLIKNKKNAVTCFYVYEIYNETSYRKKYKICLKAILINKTNTLWQNKKCKYIRLNPGQSTRLIKDKMYLNVNPINESRLITLATVDE